MSTTDHTRDSDCTLDSSGTCTSCGVYHGDPCPICQGRGFHRPHCPQSWHTEPSAPRSDPTKPWKQYLGEACPHGLLVVLVDGTYVRDNFDSDFSQGGNGFRYRFVPRGEIWVDAQINPDERPLIAFHECTESELMRGGWSYSRAHDRAKRVEDSVRRLSRSTP